MSYDSIQGITDVLAKKFSVNRSGLVVEYTDYRELPKGNSGFSRFQPAELSSRINKQKRIIENALYALIEDAEHRVPVLVATCPVRSDHSTDNRKFSQFLKYYSHQHGRHRMKNYVWVREYQKNARPHWHFCAEFQFISYVEMSRYWSGLWGSDVLNSVRKPKDLQNHFLKSAELSSYLTKYFTKEMVTRSTERAYQADWGMFSKSKKKFWGMNAELRKKAEPVILSAGFDSDRIDEALRGRRIVFSKNDVRYWR